MTDRELLEQALGMLENLYNDTELTVTQQQHRGIKAIITALRERLAQPEQEPVLSSRFDRREMFASAIEKKLMVTPLVQPL